MNFLPFNNAVQAEIELEKIVMKGHHRAARYFINFAQASTPTQWNDAALAHAAYKGLPKHIEDSLLNFPHFKSLAELRNFALEIDSRYCERKEYENLANPTRGCWGMILFNCTCFLHLRFSLLHLRSLALN